MFFRYVEGDLEARYYKNWFPLKQIVSSELDLRQKDWLYPGRVLSPDTALLHGRLDWFFWSSNLVP